MPIARDRSDLVVQEDLPVDIAPPEYKGVTVDTYKQQLSSLLIYVEGSSWITEYYSQVLNDSNVLNPNQPGLPAPYQQYTKIKELEFKVTDPLTHTQNSDTNEMEVTGSATLYAGVIPNVGDMFLADVGDGREGVFTITSSEKKALFTSTVYTVTYVITGMNGAEKRFELENKVVKTVYFRRDFVKHGQNPIIIEENVLDIEKISKHLNSLKEYYFSRFFANEHKTIILPNQKTTVYDPFLLKAVTSMFDTDEHPLLKRCLYLNIEGDEALKQNTIWTALLNVDKVYLSNAVKEVWGITTDYWSKYPLLKTIRFSGINYVVYPKHPLTTVNSQYVLGPEITGEPITDSDRIDSNGDDIPWIDPIPTIPPRVMGDWDASLGTFPTVGSGLTGQVLANDTWLVTVAGTCDGMVLAVDDFVKAVVDLPGQTAANWVLHDMNTPFVPEVPLIRPTTLDQYYVLSNAFYTESETEQSVLEVQTNNMLNNRAVNMSELYRLCDDHKNWGLLDQFYYTPILMILLKYNLRKI